MKLARWLAASAWVAGACVADPRTEAASENQERSPRLGALARATVTFPAPAAPTVDQIRQGQPYSGFGMDEEVHCSFDRPGSEMNGSTPKFRCDRLGDRFKVKIPLAAGDPASNLELYSEVAGTRLLWLAGFGADAVYPIVVHCDDCPRDPTRPPHPVNNPRTGYHGPAVAERKMPGVELDDGEGWSWTELDTLTGLTGDDVAGQRAEVDALRLFMALLQHGDCQPQQQRLVCPPGAGGSNPYLDCRRPIAILQDAGALFAKGAPGILPYSTIGSRITRFDLQAWRAVEFVSQDRRGVCRAHVAPDETCGAGLGEGSIGESGRLALLARLMPLLTGPDGRRSLDRVRAVFEAAHVERLGQSAEEWAAAFAEKVDQLDGLTCTERPYVL